MKRIIAPLICLQMALSAPALAQPTQSGRNANAIPTQSTGDRPLNPHAPGRSVRLVAKEPAPFNGRLIEDSEHARREWMNERTAGELEALKRDKGSRIVSVPALVAIIAGSLALGCGATVAVYELAR